MLFKTYIVPVNCNKLDYQYLIQCNKYSAIIWNICVKADQEYYRDNNKYLGLSSLEQLTKRQVPHILANNINYVVIKYITARSNMFKSIKAQHENSGKVKLPYKEKKFFNTGWTYQNIKFYKDKGYLTLGKPVLYDNKGSFKRQKPIKCHLKNIQIIL
jgi:putative transposase